MSSSGADDCAICAESEREFRALDCNHRFCVVCLEKLAKRHHHVIPCPHCRRQTNLPKGMKVKHLRKLVIPVHQPKVKAKPKFKVMTSWCVEGQITSVKVDEDSGTVVVASKSRGLRTYGLSGHYYGDLRADRDLSLARLAVDSKRGLILAADVDSARPAVVCLDRGGRQTGTITSSHFSHINSLAYHPELDVYIIADKGARFVYYLDPRSARVVRRIPAPAPGELVTGTALGCARGVRQWASSDWGSGVVRLWDADGVCVRAWSSRGRGFGQFEHPAGVAVSPSGRVLVSDATSHRLVWLSPPGDSPSSPGADSGLGSGGSAIDSSGGHCSPYSTLHSDTDNDMYALMSADHTPTDVCAWLEHVWPENVKNPRQGAGVVEDWQEVGTTSALGLGAPRDLDITEEGLVVASMWNDKHGPFNVAVLRGVDR